MRRGGVDPTPGRGEPTLRSANSLLASIGGKDLVNDSSANRCLYIAGWSVYPAEGLLVRGREQVRLRPKTMALLHLLAEHSGRMVDKETLLRGVWPDTIVADGGLAHCVSELRAALGDDPREPRCIETVPRRGYRLIVQAETLEGEAARPPLGKRKPVADSAVAVRDAARDRGMLRWIASAAAVLVAIAVGGLSLGGRQPNGADRDLESHDLLPRQLGPTPRIAVLSFANLTGDPDADWLGDALAFSMTAELASTESLSPVPWDVLDGLAAEILSGDIVSPSAAVLHRLRGNLGVDRVISGHFSLSASSGDRAEVEIELFDAGSGKILGAVQTTGRADRLAELARRLTNGLPSELSRGASAAKSTLDASETWLEDYFRGLRAFSMFETEEASERLERAAEASSSPWPLLALAEVHAHTGHRAEAAADVEAALTRTSGLRREERLWIEAKAYAVVERWGPAVERLQALRILAPDTLEYELRRAFGYLAAERLDEAQSAVVTALARSSFAAAEPRWRFLAGEVQLAFDRPEEALAEADEAARLARKLGAGGIEGQAVYLEARARAAAGQSHEALRSLEAARRRFAAAGDPAPEATASNALADWSLKIGDDARAREAARNALAVSRAVGDHSGEAEALRLIGFLAWKSGRREAGELALEEALEVLRHIGDRAEQARVWATQAEAAIRFSDEPARPYLVAALDLYRELGDRAQSAWMLYRLGHEALREGDLEQALEALEEAEKEAGDLDTILQSRVLFLLGHCRLWSGETYKARTVLEAAERLFREEGNGIRRAKALSHLAVVDLFTTDFEAAARRQRMSISLLEELEAPARLASSRQALAHILLEAGDLETAELLARQALERLLPLPATDESRSLAIETLARIQLASGAAAKALATLAELPDQEVEAMSFIGLRCALTRIRVLFAAGEESRARALLNAVEAHLETRGPRLLELEARLERLRSSQAGDRNPARIEQLANQARNQGLMLLASRVEALD